MCLQPRLVALKRATHETHDADDTIIQSVVVAQMYKYNDDFLISCSSDLSEDEAVV